MILSLLATLALADSITLDTGATVEGDLARYEHGGDCQLSVTEGDLAGVILIVPCHRVQSFVRTAARSPVPIGLEEEAARVSGAVAAEAAVEVPAAVATAQPELAAEVVEVPLDRPEDVVFTEPDAPAEAFYDEPLFPSDPLVPIAPSAAPPAPAAPAHSYTTDSDGPRLAPRMDAPSDPATTRSVRF